MQQKVNITNEVIKSTSQAVDGVAEVVKNTERTVEELVTPVRRRVFEKFPILFLLLATFGVTATVSGMERLMLQFDVLQNHPGFVLVIGLVILVLTGTLYKRLG